MKYLLLSLSLGLLLVTACVPQQKYLDLQKEQTQLKDEISFLDSVANSREEVETDLVEMNSDLAKAYREIEGLRATNIGLNQSYQELLQRYSNLVNQNNDIVNSSGDRQFNLQQELNMKRQELIQKENQLRQVEANLQEREARLGNLQNSYSTDVASREQRILELQSEIDRRDQQLQQIRLNVDQNFGSLNNAGATVSQKDGKIYVTLSQELLFTTGSSFVGSNGRQAISKLMGILRNDPTIAITVEGHTDNQGDPASNWKLSLDRANSVAKLLMVQGITPERISITGRGQYAPIASNASEDGRAQNRRTEIILTPREENINKLLYKQ